MIRKMKAKKYQEDKKIINFRSKDLDAGDALGEDSTYPQFLDGDEADREAQMRSHLRAQQLKEQEEEDDD